MYISDKFLKFSVYELLKIRHILKIKYVYCVVHVALKTLFLFVTFIQTYAYAHADIHTHTLTLTQIKTLHFFWKDRESKYTSILIHEI